MLPPTPPFDAEPAAPPVTRLSRILGRRVLDRQGVHIGCVEDVTVDRQRAEIAYVILSLGSAFGLGNRFHPLPWSKLRYDEARETCTADCLKAELRDAPDFCPDHRDGWDPTYFRRSVYDFFAPQAQSAWW